MFDNFWNFQGGGGVTASSLKWTIRRGGGVLYDIPSVVGVWIFSGTTQYVFDRLPVVYLQKYNKIVI